MQDGRAGGDRGRRLGSGVEGSVSGNARPDIVVWSSSGGAYAGIALNGSIIKPYPEDAQAYYGSPLGTSDIVFGHHGAAPQATGLRRGLATIG